MTHLLVTQQALNRRQDFIDATHSVANRRGFLNRDAAAEPC